MNKHNSYILLFTILMSMTTLDAFPHDIAVNNSDGKNIYYNWTNNKTELQVTYWGKSSNYSTDRYTGSVIIPEYVKYEGNSYRVTSIGRHAFNGCSGLTSVTIPNGVTIIGEAAFNGCIGLTSLNIPNSVITIEQNAFGGCKGLESLIFSNNVITIGAYAFSDCTGLTSISIPNSVKAIGNMSFSWCSKLTVVTIPNSVEAIGDGAFYNCSSLKNITIPNSVKSIGSEAFYLCYDLTSVIIGSGVTSIGNKAFISTDLKKTIWLTNTPPSGYSNAAGEINYVSNDQYSFTNQVKYQYLSSYFDVDGVRYVPVSPSERTCDAIDCVYDESAEDTKIESTVVYKGVTMNVKNVNSYLAYGNNNIETLNIDIEGILASYAFANCTNLKSVIYGDKITGFGDHVFSGCSSLTSVKTKDNIPQDNVLYISKNINSIENYAVQGCSAIKNVIMANCNTELKLGSNSTDSNCDSNTGTPLFADCPLDYVYIGRNIDYNSDAQYGYSPFYRNITLREVKITDKETEISDYEFYGCNNLQSINIGDGVTEIGKWAFSGCQSLHLFVLGSKVTRIGQEAFSDCTAVTEIISKSLTPPLCEDQALDDINKWKCMLYIPIGCSTTYQDTNQWKDFFFLLILGDANGDSRVNAADIVEIINARKSKPSANYRAKNVDIDRNGVVDQAEIDAVVNSIMR